VPVGAKFAQELQGPLKLVAVLYLLSFVAGKNRLGLNRAHYGGKTANIHHPITKSWLAQAIVGGTSTYLSTGIQT
jgi:hypothetical protein